MSQEVTAPGPSFTTITIPAGKSLSEPWTVKGKVVGFYMPAGWDAADITFLASKDKETAGASIYDAGVERSIPSAQAQAGRFIPASLNDWLGVNVLQVRSGTAALAVNQTAERKIIVALAG